MKRFTIITVCLNTENEIEETIRSVLEQDCDDFEYIIKDGCSKDRTVEIAESFAADFEKRGITYRVISCPDTGIYDAMNQATKEAQGEWVIFMNAGDRFAGKTVLSRVEESGLLESAEIVYGDVIRKNENLYLYRKARSLEAIWSSLPFSHQSVFTRKELLERVPYLQYRICGDHRFYLQMYTEGKKFSYLPIAICFFDATGISSDTKILHQDKLKMLEELPFRNEKVIQSIQAEKNILKKMEKSNFWHEHLWKYIPKQLRQMRRHRMRRKAGWKTEKEFFADFDWNEENP